MSTTATRDDCLKAAQERLTDAIEELDVDAPTSIKAGCFCCVSPREPDIGPEADSAHAEVERLRSELDGIAKRIRRLVTNLEAQEPDSEIAEDIRARLEELAAIRGKKQRALEAAEKEMAHVPDPESAEALVDSLPLLDVDWELVSDQEFRDLLAALNFEASYDATKASSPSG